MSYSQLFLITKEYKVEAIEEYKNSWLFPVPIFNYLLNKYADKAEKQAEITKLKSWRMDVDENAPLNFLGYFMFDPSNKKFNALNHKINKSKNFADRVGWELVNQQMFNSKDKDIVAQAITELQKAINADEERFSIVAKDISEIDVEKTPFFIFKNNTIDDGVERYFARYNEETDEDEEISLSEYEGELNFELVVIDGDKLMMTFVDPLQGVKR